MRDFTALLKEFEESEFFNYIGFEHVAIEEGKAAIQLKKRPEVTNLQGMLHGGAIMSGLDVVMGLTARTFGHKAASTIQMEVRFVKSVYEGVTELSAEIVHNAGTTAILNGKATDEQGDLVAYSTGTFRLYP